MQNDPNNPVLNYAAVLLAVWTVLFFRWSIVTLYGASPKAFAWYLGAFAVTLAITSKAMPLVRRPNPVQAV